jgi:hypothetical protein
VAERAVACNEVEEVGLAVRVACNAAEAVVSTAVGLEAELRNVVAAEDSVVDCRLEAPPAVHRWPARRWDRTGMVVVQVLARSDRRAKRERSRHVPAQAVRPLALELAQAQARAV